MTADTVTPAALAPTRGAPGAGQAHRARLVADVLATLTLAAVAVPLAHAGGGRDAGQVALVLPLLAAALVACRVWRVLAWGWLAGAAALAVAALAVLVVGGRSGAVAAASYGLAAGTGLLVAAWARDATRAGVAAGLVLLSGAVQVGWSLVPWWGAGDPSTPWVGTYYWYNQLAAALLLPALLGAGVVLSAAPRLRLAAWVLTPLCVAGVVLSTSRASQAALAVGWVLVAAVALRVAGPGARRGVGVRAAALSGLAAAVTVVLPGPPLFAHRSDPWAGTVARASSGQSLSTNGTFRREFFHEALHAFATHPLTGAGYGRIAAGQSVPSGWALSPLAHNTVLQALGEGGLLLGLPVAVALLAVGAALVGVLGHAVVVPAAWRGSTGRVGVASLPLFAAVAALAVGGHSLVDADASYPALGALAAACAGLGMAGLATARPAVLGGRGSDRRLALAATVVVVVALLAGAVLAWGQPFHITAPGLLFGGSA